MSEFNYLTGRPELFENAPTDALVVLEHDDGRLFYAVEHVQGARYWNEDGSPGSKVGLIALYSKTRVVASRIRANGLPPAEPKRDPIPKSRLDRMQQAQNSLKKAVSQPAPVKPKPEPAKVTPKAAASAATHNQFSACPQCGIIGIHACLGTPARAWTEQDKQRLSDAVKQITEAEDKPRIVTGDGFVSVFALPAGKRGGYHGDKAVFITIHASGNVGLSKSLMQPGDRVDLQVNPANGQVRIGKVASGGRELAKSKVFGCKPLRRLIRFPEGVKSVRIYLTEINGWWQGQAELADAGKART